MTKGRTPRRVWITGLGLVTPIGIGLEPFWDGLCARRSPVKRIDRFDPSPFRSQVAAQVDDFTPGDFMDARAERSLDRFSQFAMAAGRLAIADADLRPGARSHPRADRVAVYVGSALGGIAYAEVQHERYLERGIRSVAPNLALAVFGGAAPANVGIMLGLHGPILSTANSCAAGAVALGEAFHLIRDGGADAALAGGVEVPLSPLAFGAFDIIRALSAGHNDQPESAARPFDSGRDGFVMGEGAALLVLEEAGVAARRGARPYAEVRGFAATSDAHHMVQPRPDGRQAARAARLALADGRLKAAEVDLVSAHASSTPLGDVAEARAIRLALGARAATVPVTGTKAYYGHPLGASGAIEAAICALAVHRGWSPGTLNLREPDPAVVEAVPCISADPVTGPFEAVLSTSFGFGGLNAALAFSPPSRVSTRRVAPSS
ncbi:beta-ketoacyl-ACP synthase II [soil metagenome]